MCALQPSGGEIIKSPTTRIPVWWLRLGDCSLRCFSPLAHEFTLYLSLLGASAFVQLGCKRREDTPTRACSFSGEGETGMWIFSLLLRTKCKNIAVLHPERWKLAAGISHVPLVLTNTTRLGWSIQSAREPELLLWENCKWELMLKPQGINSCT